MLGSKRTRNNLASTTISPFSCVLFVSSSHQTGPFGFNEQVEIGVSFSLPVSVLDADETSAATTTHELPTLSVVVGSTSTALTTTYLTAEAVYTNEDLSGLGAANVLFFKYLVAADDESVDLRWVRHRHCSCANQTYPVVTKTTTEESRISQVSWSNPEKNWQHQDQIDNFFYKSSQIPFYKLNARSPTIALPTGISPRRRL